MGEWYLRRDGGFKPNTSVFLFPVNTKSAREPRILAFVHGHFLGSRVFFQKINGQVVVFTGTFLDVLTGTFSGFTGKKNEIFTDTL